MLGKSQRARILDTQTGQAIAFEEFVAQLANYDVVFLGENHGHQGTHRLQARTTAALHALRPNMALSLEQFERDVQGPLDDYLAGLITEEELLEVARPWGNYESDYRPGVEWAKANRVPVIAANVPRPLAKKASQEGLEAVLGNPHVAQSVDVSEGAYWKEFQRLLAGMMDHGGGHGSGHGEGEEEGADSMLKRMYVAQCVKDSTMAESIANQYFAVEISGVQTAESQDRIVVHWCGRAHSDYRLGTVERLPEFISPSKVAVVSIVTSADEYPDEPHELADFLWVFPY